MPRAAMMSASVFRTATRTGDAPEGPSGLPHSSYLRNDGETNELGGTRPARHRTCLRLVPRVVRHRRRVGRAGGACVTVIRGDRDRHDIAVVHLPREVEGTGRRG